MSTISAEEMTKQLEELLKVMKSGPNKDMAPYAAQLEEFLKKRDKAGKEIRKVEVAADMVLTSAV